MTHNPPIDSMQESIGHSLSKAIKLQAIRINFLKDFVAETICLDTSQEDVRQIAEHCGPSIMRIGNFYRRWEVRLMENACLCKPDKSNLKSG